MWKRNTSRQAQACGEAEADRQPHAKEIPRILLNPDFDSWYRK
jgi:hypothetical protein